ncbi:hypothetical protein SUNI508_13909 [Seiridium unicorne]|uniref:Uncharacterized protein n=1 Tax=Seiridium unicorne TaxID=138068 RepID=A0ABR2VA13_9PEZI
MSRSLREYALLSAGNDVIVQTHLPLHYPPTSVMEDLIAATDFVIGLPLLATIASALHQQPSTVLKVREERDQIDKDRIPQDKVIPMPIAKLTPRLSPSETRTKSNIMLEKYPHAPIGSDKYRTSISSSWKSKDYMMAPFKPGAGLIQVGLKQLESREQGTVKVSDIGAYAVLSQLPESQYSGPEHLIRRNNELKITSDRYRPSVASIHELHYWWVFNSLSKDLLECIPTGADDDIITASGTLRGRIKGAGEASLPQRNNVMDYYPYTYAQQKPSLNHTTIIMPTALNKETLMDRPDDILKAHQTLGPFTSGTDQLPSKGCR